MKKPKLIRNMSSVFQSSTRMSDVGKGIGGRIRQQPQPKRPTRASSPSAPNKEKPLDKRTRHAVLRRRIIMCVIAVICIAAGTLSGSVIFGKEAAVPINVNYTNYLHILTNVERQEWQDNEQETGKAYVQMQTRVGVNELGAEIRLINPPYSAYKQRVVIKLDESENTLYESDMMLPGTVVEYAEIKGLEAGTYEAIAEFTFYNENEVKRGDYKLNIQLDVE